MSLNGSSSQSPLDTPEHEQQAALLSQAAFPAPDNVQRVVETITHFVDAYDQHRNEMPLVQWLTQQFNQYPELWKNTNEADQTAQQLIAANTRLAQHKASLQQHFDKGKSLANWLAKELEQDAQAQQNLDTAAHAEQLKSMLASANQALLSPLSGQALNAPLDRHEAPHEPQPSVWDEQSRLSIAKELNDQARLNAALSTASPAQILSQRAATWVNDRQSTTSSQTLTDFFNSPLNSTGNIDAQTIVAGGVLIAAKKGWIAGFDAEQVEEIAANVNVTLERAKALYQLGEGDVLADAAMHAIENATMVAARSLAQVAQEKCTQLGVQWGAVLGAPFGPAGIALGSTVGGAVGRLAGKAVGSLIEKGARKVVEVADKVVRKTIEKIKDVGRQVLSSVANFATSFFA